MDQLCNYSNIKIKKKKKKKEEEEEKEVKNVLKLIFLRQVKMREGRREGVAKWPKAVIRGTKTPKNNVLD
jgi:hypothetical protein